MTQSQNNANPNAGPDGGPVHAFIKLFSKLRWVWLVLCVITLINSAGYLFERFRVAKAWGEPPALESMRPVEGVLINFETAEKLSNEGGELDESTAVPVLAKDGARTPKADRDADAGADDTGAPRTDEADATKDETAPGEDAGDKSAGRDKKDKKKKGLEWGERIEEPAYSGVHVYNPDTKKVRDFYCDFPSSLAIDTFTGEGGPRMAGPLNTCDWVYREIALRELCENCGNVTKLYGNKVSVRADDKGYVYELLIDGKKNLSYENMTLLYKGQIDKFNVLFSRFLGLGLILMIFTFYGFHFARKFRLEDEGGPDGPGAPPANEGQDRQEAGAAEEGGTRRDSEDSSGDDDGRPREVPEDGGTPGADGTDDAPKNGN